jgi:hypothetical protein
MNRSLTALLFLSALLHSQLHAAPRDTASWQNVQALDRGVRVEVSRKTGDTLRGTLGSVSPDSLTILVKQQETAVPRADVLRVVKKRQGHAKWIGLGIGAGAGAGVGAALGARLANESAGDIDVKALSIAAVAAAGALIGLAIGAGLDSRHSTVYISH